ncbi:hypothetical protein B0H14DRAFT_2211325, partial [Mycena olivaceomarginata]
MKFTTIVIAVGLASATYTVADNCKKGLSYCGRGLLHKDERCQMNQDSDTCLRVLPGNYADQIERAIQKAHSNPAHIPDTLFYCIGGSDGDIEVI